MTKAELERENRKLQLEKRELQRVRRELFDKYHLLVEDVRALSKENGELHERVSDYERVKANHRNMREKADMLQDELNREREGSGMLKENMSRLEATILNIHDFKDRAYDDVVTITKGFLKGGEHD